MSESVEGFLRYVRPHLRPLHHAARQYAARPEDTQDLVQEVLLRAWRNFSATDDRVYRQAWLFVILRNVAAEWRRTARRRIRLVPLEDAELTEMASVDPAGPLCPLPVMSEGQFREFLDDHIAAALDALAAPFREVLVLSVAGGLSYREIADVLDCPVGTVMSRMARARKTLRERLGEAARTRKRGDHREVRP